MSIPGFFCTYAEIFFGGIFFCGSDSVAWVGTLFAIARTMPATGPGARVGVLLNLKWNLI
jgi:hypothetical protein